MGRLLPPFLALAFLGAWGCVQPEPEPEPEPEPQPQPQPDDLVQHGPVICADPARRAAEGPFEDAWTFPADAGWAHGSALAVADLDGDGRTDVWLPGRPTPQTFHQDEAGGFAESSEAPGGGQDPTQGAVASFLDLDGDGDIDGVVGRAGEPVNVLENVEGTFTILPGDPLGPSNDEVTRGFAWADMDGDGDLDLAVANDMVAGQNPLTPAPCGLFERVGDYEFVDVSDRLSVVPPGFTKLAVWIDPDRDGDLDLYLVNHVPLEAPTQLLLNDGTGRFTAAPELGLDLEMQGMGFDSADLNGDGAPEYALAGLQEIAILESQPGGWARIDLAAGVRPSEDPTRWSAWSSAWVDLDNDGVVELHAGFGPLDGDHPGEPVLQPDALYRRGADAQFVQVAEAWGLAQDANDRAVAFVDLDRDGWLDAIKRAERGPATLHRARCGAEGWLQVDLRGPAGNPHGIGASVTVEAEGLRAQTRWITAQGPGYLANQPPEAHFGLGGNAVAQRLVVSWPDGARSVFTSVAGSQSVTVLYPDG